MNENYPIVDGEQSIPAGAILANLGSNDNETIQGVHPAGTTQQDAFGTGDNRQIFALKKRPQNSEITDSSLDYYSMTSSRGRAIVINNENFESCTRMNKRTGTDIDAKNLWRTFKKLDFQVDVYKDTKCKKLCKIITDSAKDDHTGLDCFVLAILSHGDDGCIYGTDGTIEIKDIVDQYRGEKCPTLAGKPKIFIFQACRGTLHEIPIEPSGDVVDGEVEMQPHIVEIDAAPQPTLPSASDFLFCYSVVEGFYSHRDTLFGSWYVQEFTTAMEDLVFKGDGKPVDFLDVLTLVNRKVARRSVERSLSKASLGKKQMPCFLSMLTKKLYLMPAKQSSR